MEKRPKLVILQAKNPVNLQLFFTVIEAVKLTNSLYPSPIRTPTSTRSSHKWQGRGTVYQKKHGRKSGGGGGGDRGTCSPPPPHVFEGGGHNIKCPPTFLGLDDYSFI